MNNNLGPLSKISAGLLGLSAGFVVCTALSYGGFIAIRDSLNAHGPALLAIFLGAVFAGLFVCVQVYRRIKKKIYALPLVWQSVTLVVSLTALATVAFLLVPMVWLNKGLS